MTTRTLAPLILLLGLLQAAACLALPQGKAWAPTATIELPGFVYLGPPRLDWNGKDLLLQTIPQANFGGDARGFIWSDSLWSGTWRLGYPTLLFWPVIAPHQEVHLVWGGASESTAGTYLLAQVLGTEISPPDTIARVAVGRTEYAAAVGARRRWFVVNDRIPDPAGPALISALRIFYSDTATIWREAPIAGSADYGVTIAPVDDTTAVVVWASRVFVEKLQWGLLRGREWIARGQLSDDVLPVRPRLRRRPSGGYWLSWGNNSPDVQLSAFVGDHWTPPLRITADYLVEPHNQHFGQDTDMSRDAGEHPIVAWDTQSPFSGGEIAVSFPTMNGYSLGEVVPGSGVGGLPSVARDPNGDAWIAWWRTFGPTRWTHTYTRATPGEVFLRDHGRRRSIVWTLDEPAPESWWTVLCSRNGEPFVEAARVQAGVGLEVAWIDDSPSRGHVRYKVRRDCLDARYRWESEVVAWPPRAVRTSEDASPAKLGSKNRVPPTLKPPVRPVGQHAELEVAGVAPGPVEIAIFDLQGRKVLARTVEATLEGQLRFSLAETSPPPTSGVYFARASDSSGALSNTVRLVILR